MHDRPALFPRLLTAFLAIAALGRAAGADPAPIVESWPHPSLSAADHDALALDWLADVAREPDSPAVEVLLLGVERVRTLMSDFSAMRPALERMIHEDRVPGFGRVRLRRLLLDCLEESGDWEAAAKLRDGLGLVRRWSVIGGFGITNRSCFDESFAPEIRPDDPALTAEGANGTPAWRPTPPPGINRTFDPFTFLWPRQGACYAVAQVRLDAPADAVLTLLCAGATKVWVNDAAALVVDRFHADPPVDAAARVHLRAGWNRILVKAVAGSISGFELYLTDAEGRAIAPAAVEEGADVHLLTAEREPGAPPAPFAWPARAHFDAVAREPGPHAPREVALGALLAHWSGQEDEAMHRIRAALERGGEDSAVQHFAAEIYGAADHCPETFTRSRAQEHYRRAVALDPGFAPSWFGLSNLLESDHKTAEAIDALHEPLKAHPNCAAAHLFLLRLYRAREWTPQAEEEAKRLEAMSPGSAVVAAYRVERAREERNFAEARVAAEKLAAHRSAGVFQLVNALDDLGEKEKALALWRELAARTPDDPNALRRQAEMEETAGHVDDAEKTLQRVLRWIPDHASAWRSLGDVRLRAGRRDAALEAYRRALEIDPSDASLRRELAWLDARPPGKPAADQGLGDPDQFWVPYLVDVRKLIPNSPRRADLPTSSVTYLLDQAVVRLNPDGSYSEYIHQAVKILNERGVDKYDKVTIEGEILEARTLCPDGSVLEPVVIPRQRELTMPRVEEGVVLDYAFRRHSRGRPLGKFTYPNFYFQDPAFDGAFMVSEFILLVPKGFPFRYAEENMAQRVQIKDLGDMLVYRWRVENGPHIEPEGHMPHYRTLLPYVSIGEEESWQEVWAVLRENFLQRCMPTHDLRDFAAKVCAGLPGRREQAEALYYAVLDLVRDSGGFEPAQLIFMQRTGNRLLLLKTLYDIAGVPSAFVATRPNGMVEPPPPGWSLPRADDFDGVSAEGLLLRVELEDRSTVYLSGAGRYLPFGEFPVDRRGGWGLVLTDTGPEHVSLPVGDPSLYRTAAERVLGTTQEFEFEPTREGPAKVTCRGWSPGPESTFWKERFADVDASRRKKYVETIYNPTFPGLVVDDLEFPGLDSAREPFRVNLSLRIPSFLTARGERLSCGTGLVTLQLQHAFVSESKRKLPIHLPEGYGTRASVTIRLPAGIHCRRLPENLTLQSAFGSYSLLFARAEGEEAVRVSRVYLIPAQDIAPADYGKFMDFCRRIDQAEAQRIALDRGE